MLAHPGTQTSRVLCAGEWSGRLPSSVTWPIALYGEQQQARFVQVFEVWFLGNVMVTMHADLW